MRTSKVVTLEMSHELMSSLKVLQFTSQSALAEAHEQKRYDRSVTAVMSHRPIGPYIAVAVARSAHHTLRASRRDERLAKTWPLDDNRLIECSSSSPSSLVVLAAPIESPALGIVVPCERRVNVEAASREDSVVWKGTSGG